MNPNTVINTSLEKLNNRIINSGLKVSRGKNRFIMKVKGARGSIEKPTLAAITSSAYKLVRRRASV